MLSDKSILITGGTGSFGKAFVRTVLAAVPRRQAAGRLFARRTQAVRDGAFVLRPYISRSALFHRRHPRRSAPPSRAGRHRHRRARRRAEAGAGRRVQPLRVHQDQRARRAEPDRSLPGQPCRARRRPVHRQGRRAHQPVRRHQALLGQAVRRRQQHQGQSRHPLQRRALWQRDGQPRLGDPVFLANGARPACCRSPIHG